MNNKAYKIIERKIEYLRDRLRRALEHNDYTEAQKLEGGIFFLESVYMELIQQDL